MRRELERRHRVLANRTQYNFIGLRELDSLCRWTLNNISSVIRGGEYPYFTGEWFRNHRGAWFPGFWAGGLGLWDVPDWSILASYTGVTGPAINYNYGTNVQFVDGDVYLNGEPLCSTADFANQAIALNDIGRSARPSQNDEWEPLGVFGLVQGSETVAQRIFQLAVNKNGIIRGNYYDAVAATNQPVYGKIDPKSQRVVWSIGNKRDTVFEAGLNNLVQSETNILIHFGRNRTVQMILVRLTGPTPPFGAPALPLTPPE